MAQAIKHHWINGGGDTETPTITALDSGHVLVIANADTDADGAPDATVLDGFGDPETSLRKPMWKGDGDYVNARIIPYFVLPNNWNTVTGIQVNLGDFAKASYQGKVVYCILADIGPDDKIGELSIAAVEALGGFPWNADRTKIISGLGHGVSYEIIPGSAILESAISFESIQVAGQLAFRDHPQIKKGEKFIDATWFEMNRKNDGRPTITAYKAGTPLFTRIIKGKSDLLEFLNLFPNANTVLVAETDKKIVPQCPDTVDTSPKPQGTSSQKFVSFFRENYETVRNEVDSWFTKEPGIWENNPVTNGCVAHQVSCLNLCNLPAPGYDTIESVNVGAFIDWAKLNGWRVINDVSALIPGDICVSASTEDVYDHVYCFYSYKDPGNAYVLHNQEFGLAVRSLDGSRNGPWKFALRML
jgi:hypothetical protein